MKGILNQWTKLQKQTATLDQHLVLKHFKQLDDVRTWEPNNKDT